MAGYANRVINLEFRELSADWENDPIRVVIRNPRLMPPNALQRDDVETDENGQPKQAAANQVMYEIIAKLVVGWRVYDASDLALDPETFEPQEQKLLPKDATPERVKKLPSTIVNRIVEEMTKAANPSAE